MFKEIEQYNSRCLLFSGGLDSTLLLALMREHDVHADIVTVGYSEWGKAQKKRFHDLVKLWDLKILTFPPSGISFIGDGENISAVYEYPVGSTTIPVIRDLIDGDKCIAELDGMRLHQQVMKWDCYITGGRKADKHYALENGVVPDRTWKLGSATFIAPLFDWTREEVQIALKAMGLPWEEVTEDADSGNLILCQKCLKATAPIECPKDGTMINPSGTHLQLNLEAFRKRFQIL